MYLLYNENANIKHCKQFKMPLLIVGAALSIYLILLLLEEHSLPL